jgi:nucleoside-diphosphate-sugar epimerase
MRIFLAGATGAVGSRLLQLLVAAGHAVVGTTRTGSKAAALRAAGAEPVVVDGLDHTALRSVVIDAKPDIVIDELTALGGVPDLRRFDRYFAMTNRLRSEGLDILLASAQEAGARRFIAQSYCGWPYARIGSPVKDEDAPLDADPPRAFKTTLAAIRHLENRVAGARGIEGMALRYGAFYGPGTGMLDESVLDAVRRRRLPLIGDGGGWWSFLHVEDAAAATALAIEHGAPGIYNIVDDEPAPVSAWLPVLADILGARRPRRVPRWLARAVIGDHFVAMMTGARAGTNARAKAALDWRPRYPSWRQGFRAVLAPTL